MTDTKDAVSVFRNRLYARWLPAFCKERGYDLGGFRDASIRVGPVDAANLLRAMDGGLVEEEPGGRYRCALSRAREQLFWELAPVEGQRPIVLWMEPVITLATVARLHYDLGWPKARIGMQTRDFAFDLAAYDAHSPDRLVIACEVKKSVAELDHLCADLRYHSRERSDAPISASRRHVNSFRKWAALRRDRPHYLWLVGPEGREYVFGLGHDSGMTTLSEVPLTALRFGHHTTEVEG